MDEATKILVAFLGSTTFGLSALIFYLIINPEKIEKWTALIYKFFINVGIVIRVAKKKYIQHDAQYRINSFLKQLIRQIPEFDLKKFSINWYDSANTSVQAFIDNDEVVIHLNENEPENENIAHTVYHFVSTSLLARAKRYITISQRKSLDVFVTGDILKDKGFSVVNAFLEEYLHDELREGSGKVKHYYDKYDQINKSGHFYTILLNELNSIGAKIFGQKRDSKIFKEVDELIDFIIKFSNRTIGDEDDLNFEKDTAKFAIIIVGKKIKVITSPEVYSKYIKKLLKEKKLNHIYLVGALFNKELMDQVADDLKNTHEIMNTRQFKSKQRFKNSEEKMIDSYTIVLRCNDQEINI